ncbi:MAG: helix-turn-helix transcriptional regulator [Myxococcota bacterium]
MTASNAVARVNETAKSPRKPAQAVKERRPRKSLIKLRKTIGWTQENLAANIGASTRSISRWENGHTKPSPEVRDDLAKALRITVHQLEALLDYLPLPPAEKAPVETKADTANVVSMQAHPAFDSKTDTLSNKDGQLAVVVILAQALAALADNQAVETRTERFQQASSKPTTGKSVEEVYDRAMTSEAPTGEVVELEVTSDDTPKDIKTPKKAVRVRSSSSKNRHRKTSKRRKRKPIRPAKMAPANQFGLIRPADSGPPGQLGLFGPRPQTVSTCVIAGA